MVQRVFIIIDVFANRRVSWDAQGKVSRSFPDYCIFHMAEVLLGLGLLSSIERGFLTFWFLPLAICLAFTPVLSWWSARPAKYNAHENLNAKTPL
jgi:membrane glycosyltransferase